MAKERVVVYNHLCVHADHLVSRADRALGRLDGSIQTLPDADLFVFMYVRKEAVLSSQIEGTQSSLNDLLEAEANIMNTQRPRDVAEVLNYVNAMNYGIKRLVDLPFSIRLTKEIHARLLEGVRGAEREPGKVRRIVDSIGRATANGLTVLESLYSLPIITVNNIAKMTSVSFTAANNLMNRFVGENILIESTGQARNRQFRYTDYINLFASR